MRLPSLCVDEWFFRVEKVFFLRGLSSLSLEMRGSLFPLSSSPRDEDFPPSPDSPFLNKPCFSVGLPPDQRNLPFLLLNLDPLRFLFRHFLHGLSLAPDVKTLSLSPFYWYCPRDRFRLSKKARIYFLVFEEIRGLFPLRDSSRQRSLPTLQSCFPFPPPRRSLPPGIWGWRKFLSPPSHREVYSFFLLSKIIRLTALGNYEANFPTV